MRRVEIDETIKLNSIQRVVKAQFYDVRRSTFHFGAFLISCTIAMATLFGANAMAQNSCQITQKICPYYPTVSGTFEDVWGDQNLGANTSASACLARAQQYYNWCGGPSQMDGATTTARFYSNGVANASQTVGNSCQISQNACPNSPTTIGTFEDIAGDQNLGANTSASACLARAQQYYNWCGGPSRMDGAMTTATFYSNGVANASQTVGNSCQISQNACPNSPTTIGTFEDIAGDQNLGANTSASACLARAQQYYNWCGGASLMGNNTTTARFYQNGTLAQQTTAGAAPAPATPQCNLTATSYTYDIFMPNKSDYITATSVQQCAQFCAYRHAFYCSWWPGWHQNTGTNTCYAFPGLPVYGAWAAGYGGACTY